MFVAVAGGYVISDAAFDHSLREDARIALTAVSYDGCTLKHVAVNLRSMAKELSCRIWELR